MTSQVISNQFAVPGIFLAMGESKDNNMNKNMVFAPPKSE